jgi:HSP20 family protein
MENENNPFKRRKRPARDIDDIFRNFWTEKPNKGNHEYLDPIEEHMKRISQFMNGMLNESEKQNSQSQNSEEPWFYGFTYSAGTDKEPTFKEFGNIPQKTSDNHVQLTEKQEPFIDIQEEEKEVYVTVEIPGVLKENINLTVTQDTLIIDVNHDVRGFHKSVSLPTVVKENKSKASYNNGVLHIALQKTKPKSKGKNINIE